jgi:hypothetical protein
LIDNQILSKARIGPRYSKMPRTKSEDSRKRTYELWFEFLLLSKNYKDFCEWKRTKGKKASYELPEKFNKLDIILPFTIGYHNFGDIYKVPFNKWWEIKKSFFLTRKLSRSVVKFTVGTEIENAIESFKLAEGRNPSLNEFKEYFIGLMDSPKRVILSVTLKRAETVQDLGLQFDKLIRRLEPKFRSNNWPWEWKFPTTTKRLEEIQRYLDVYKLYCLQGRSPSEIASQMKHYSEHVSSSREKRRMIQSDIRNAERIIRNVEKGIFPGKY